MRRLIPYGLGVAVFAGAEYLFFYVMYVYVLCGSLACAPYGVPYDFRAGRPQFTGWDILFSNYFIGMLGAVGGLLGLVVAARLELRHSWGSSLAQGIIAMLAPSATRGLLRYSSVPDIAILVTDIAILVSAGAIGALLALGFYIAGGAVVRWVTVIYRWTLRAFADDVIERAAPLVGPFCSSPSACRPAAIGGTADEISQVELFSC